MAPMKQDWILCLLGGAPLDRIHIMKALFLLWHRIGRSLPGFFRFEPYLYGPCSFELYDELGSLSRAGLVVQPPHPRPQWVRYYLTARGRAAAIESAERLAPEHRNLLDGVAREIAGLGFEDLLRRVYAEAPDFAVNSLFRGGNR